MWMVGRKQVLEAIIFAIIVLFLGRLAYAIVLALIASITRIWIPAERIGSTIWAFKSLYNWQHGIPYLLWGCLMGLSSTAPPRWRFWLLLICILGLWAHRTELGLFSLDYWRISFVIELIWIALFLPLCITIHYWINLISNIYKNIAEQIILR